MIVYVLLVVAVGTALISLGIACSFYYHLKIRKRQHSEPDEYPRVAVISPYRGDVDFTNLDALMNQEYPGTWEVFLVTTKDDASLPSLEEYSQRLDHVHLVLADDVVSLATERGVHRGQKNQNLLTALEKVSSDVEVFTFIDADTCPHKDWLRKLVTPLTTGDPELGAVTSARIYVPDGGLASNILSSWVIGSSTFLLGPWGYVWGGGFAITRNVFESARISQWWDGTEGSITSDDLNLTVALKKNGYRTYFVPECLMLKQPPEKRETFKDVLTFTNRQLHHVWWVRKDLWMAIMSSHVTKTLASISALITSMWHPVALFVLVVPLIDLAVGIAMTKALTGSVAIQPEIQRKLNKTYIYASLTGILVTINALTAPFFRKMRWGGIEYTRRKVIGHINI